MHVHQTRQEITVLWLPATSQTADTPTAKQSDSRRRTVASNIDFTKNNVLLDRRPVERKAMRRSQIKSAVIWAAITDVLLRVIITLKIRGYHQALLLLHTYRLHILSVQAPPLRQPPAKKPHLTLLLTDSTMKTGNISNGKHTYWKPKCNPLQHIQSLPLSVVTSRSLSTRVLNCCLLVPNETLSGQCFSRRAT